MINTNDLAKIAFFPERDSKKIEQQNPFFADSGSFLTTLQTISEENREFPQTNLVSSELDGSYQAKSNDTMIPEKREDGNQENTGISNQKVESVEEKSFDEIVDNEALESKEPNTEMESSTSSSIQSDKGKDEKNPNRLEAQHIFNDLGIASMLLPSFHKETNGLEIFQDKLLSGNSSPTQSSKNLFPKKADLQETGDLLKTAFDSQKKISNEKGSSSKENGTKDIKESKETTSSLLNVKQILDELKMQTSKTLKADEKGLEFAKSNLSSSLTEFIDSDGQNEKKIKSNKKKTNVFKGIGLSEKKQSDTIGTEKISNNENVSISKNSKEENKHTTITDKLKRTELNLKRDKSPDVIPEIKNESQTELKSTEKNSPSPFVIDSKQKMNDSKIEVKSVQKQDSLGQNFKEIVKAAKFHIVENGKNTAEISLQPKDLGKVTLYVTEENSRMEGRITVENESVRQMILGELANLKADLKASGLDLFEIQVDLQQEMNHPFAQGENSEERRSTGNYSEYSQEVISEDETNDLSLEPSSSRLLDLKV